MVITQRCYVNYTERFELKGDYFFVEKKVKRSRSEVTNPTITIIITILQLQLFFCSAGTTKALVDDDDTKRYGGGGQAVCKVKQQSNCDNFFLHCVVLYPCIIFCLFSLSLNKSGGELVAAKYVHRVILQSFFVILLLNLQNHVCSFFTLLLQIFLSSVIIVCTLYKVYCRSVIKLTCKKSKSEIVSEILTSLFFPQKRRLA